MPALPILPALRDATIPLLHSLIPRDPEAPGPVARQPAIASSADAPIALDALSHPSITRRAVLKGIIPTYYNTSGPGTGLTVGIVLGSVLGFLFLGWLFWQLTNVNASTTAIAGEEEIVVRRRRNSHNSHSGRSRRSTHAEMRQHHSRSPRRSGRQSTVIVDERRSRPRSVLVEERRHRVPGDNMVEVVEEHSDSYESVSRRDSRSGRGYRY